MSQPRADRRYTTSADDDAAVDWRTSAACLDIDPELFFPVQSAPERAEPAKHVCRRCPAVRACLSEALTHDVTGVWGGTTFAEREQIRTEHGITAASILSRLPVDSPALMVDHMTGGGSSAKEIAERIGMTPRTVVRYRTRINEGLRNDHHA